MKNRIVFLFFCALPLFLALSFHARVVAQPQVALPPGVLEQGFLYEEAPFASCHASTIEESKSGLVAAWFGGTGEGNPDVGIWYTRQEKGAWSAPVQVADGIESSDRRYPCWNPVLFQVPGGPLLLFYKVGPNPRQWWGMVRRSGDGAKSWSAAERLPDGILGPIKNKPVMTPGGWIVSPSSTEDEGWKGHLEISRDRGKSWEKTAPVNDPREFGLIQPTVLIHSDQSLQLLFRSRQGRIVACRSTEGALRWGPAQATELPNPNSGIDAVTLKDGRFLLVYNHTARGRSPLNVALSADGRRWEAAVRLETEPGEYSYPAVIQDSRGKVHVTYTWKRKKIRYVVLDPDRLPRKEIQGGLWPD